MPPKRDPVKIWSERITAANKDYDTWAKEYQVKRLLDYYLGKHWPGLSEEEREKKYTINLVFATVENQLPSLLFTNPHVECEGRPETADAAGSDSAARATLIQHTLQTQVDNPRLHFLKQTTLSLRDAYWRFGIAEVGYTGDYIDNPNADKPLLNDDDKPVTEDDGQGGQTPVLQPARILREGGKESLFVKHLPPQNVRVWPGRNILEENDWVAYAEWHTVADVVGNKDYKNTAGLKATGAQVNDNPVDDDPDREKHKGQVRIWKIFDLRGKVRHLYAEGHKKMLQEGKPMPFLPLADLKFYEIPESYYPMPPLFNWQSPQDEINESREQQKVHRRRFNRRYTRDPRVSQNEFEKLETGGDGVCIEVSNPAGAIVPVPDADLSAQNWTQLGATKDDYALISGTSGEARGIPEADTATQANIINVRAQIRESSQRGVVGAWLANICRLMLLTIRESVQLPLMVKRSVDEFASPGPDTADAAKLWSEVKVEEIDDLEVDIRIDLAQLSPVAEEQQRVEWNGLLTTLTNPQVGPVMFIDDPQNPGKPSPVLRKTLRLNGIKSEQEIQAIYRIGKASMKAQADAAMAQAQAAQPPKPPNVTYGFKGEDMADPLVRQAFINAEHLQSMAGATAVAPGGQGGPVPPPSDAGPADLGQPAAGPTTGTPAGV